jgi:hypothetical protein
MTHLVSSPHPWIVLGLLAIYCAASWVVSSQHLLVATNALLLVVSGVVGVAFAGQAIRFMRGRDPAFLRLSSEERSRTIHISFGIALAWLDTFAWRVIISFWLLSRMRPSLVSNDVLPALYFLCAVGCFYHLTSPGVLARTYRGRTISCVTVVAAAALLGAIQIWYAPDLTWLAVVIEPWIPR